jgi:branched-chain amino acid aminotransferase
MKYANVNGKIVAAAQAVVPADNGAFRYGLGLFETMLIQDGHIRLAQYHWDRLFAGLTTLQFDIPHTLTPEYLTEQVLALVKKNDALPLCRVRLQLHAQGGGLYDPDPASPAFVIECFPLEASILELNANGLAVGIATDLYKSADALANLKSCNALIYAMAARQATAGKWNDALIRNTAGNIIESTIANIFWFKDGTLYTPPLTEGCVAGTMRRYIMSKSAVTEHPLAIEALLDADEIFLSNAIRGVRWVGDVAGRRYDKRLVHEVYELVNTGARF